MCDIIESVRRTPCTDKELARFIRRLLKKMTIAEIAEKSKNTVEWLEGLLKENPVFIKDLEELINKYSLENGSNTPDFILAEYLKDCLVAFDKASRAREK